MCVRLCVCHIRSLKPDALACAAKVARAEGCVVHPFVTMCDGAAVSSCTLDRSKRWFRSTLPRLRRSLGRRVGRRVVWRVVGSVKRPGGRPTGSRAARGTARRAACRTVQRSAVRRGVLRRLGRRVGWRSASDATSGGASGGASGWSSCAVSRGVSSCRLGGRRRGPKKCVPSSPGSSARCPGCRGSHVALAVALATVSRHARARRRSGTAGVERARRSEGPSRGGLPWEPGIKSRATSGRATSARGIVCGRCRLGGGTHC